MTLDTLVCHPHETRDGTASSTEFHGNLCSGVPSLYNSLEKNVLTRILTFNLNWCDVSFFLNGRTKLVTQPCYLSLPLLQLQNWQIFTKCHTNVMNLGTDPSATKIRILKLCMVRDLQPKNATCFLGKFSLQNVNNNMVALRKFSSIFNFDNDKSRSTGPREMKFEITIKYKYSCKLCMKQCSWVNNYKHGDGTILWGYVRQI
jgi:hypothetical protein